MTANNNEWQRAKALNTARRARYSMSFRDTPLNQSTIFVARAVKVAAGKLMANG